MTVQHQHARKGENFPVASLLIPGKYRPAILALYDFARGADNIADGSNQDSGSRLQLLEELQHNLQHKRVAQLPDWAQKLPEAAKSAPTLLMHANLLLEAFKQDCTTQRYSSWEELIAYCQLSAVPVGRAVLEVCEETNANQEASDALCIALQLLNHLQDTRDDYHSLNRLYWPQHWLDETGATESMLQEDTMSTQWCELYNRALHECDTLLLTAQPLPATIAQSGLRVEVRVILQAATLLRHKLAQEDAFTKRVRLTTAEKLYCLGKGVMG